MEPDIFDRAISYPYRIPKQSFVLRDGNDYPLSTADPLSILERRTAVLAVGSNQSPEQLARKFTDNRWGEIPVIRSRIRNFDSVYSAHIASYGSVAATLQHAPGVELTLFVTWLTPPQLQRMHETEIANKNYVYGCLDGVQVTCEFGPNLKSAHIYSSSHGALSFKNSPIPLAEIPAKNRRWNAMSQIEVQNHIRRRLAPKKDLTTFIQEAVDDPLVRRERTNSLRQDTRPFSYPNFRELALQ